MRDEASSASQTTLSPQKRPPSASSSSPMPVVAFMPARSAASSRPVLAGQTARNTNPKESAMSTLLCTVDHTSRATEAAEAAIERCREPGSELVLVGVVEPQSEAPAPAFGERIRRFGLVEKNLVRAARAVRAAGLTPTVVLRFGERSAETLAVADEV